MVVAGGLVGVGEGGSAYGGSFGGEMITGRVGILNLVNYFGDYFVNFEVKFFQNKKFRLKTF
jgi:hypothetical protein